MGKPDGFPIERAVAGVFAAVAVLTLAAAAASGVNTRRALAREVAAPGRVVGMTPRAVEVPRESPDRDGRRGTVARQFFYPVVEFDLPDGLRQVAQTADGSWPPAYQVGQPVTVLYDRENPLDARVASDSGTLLRWTWTLITGALGAAFAVAAILVYRAFVRRPGPA